ncbi:competence protein CelA [Lentibacillus kapialis]|uniref:Competence protein CelA n=1 Tax=Lentibacillus kapialis TaxID=340214 RepID=A0A917PLS6_9BACI|nr:helix-hairpin-helix domain-containing protein [Lentibacillus kapialis]GGJ83566.1 competence protein CelA [Lentibacillus kapialis]
MLDPLKKYIFPIAITVGIVIFLIFNNHDTDKIVSQSKPVPKETSASKEDETEQTSAKVMVDVKGEIVRPGVYEIETESRVNEIIQMAGGFTEDADRSMVNLAQKVQDEMVIMIPKMGEEMSASVPGNSDHDKVRINYATQEEIESLSGIGPSKAAAIIQYRDENGHFKTADDLLDVSGIGDKTLESLKDDIQIP